MGPLPYTVHKNKLKVGLKLKCETLNFKTYRRKNKGKASRHLSWQWLLGFDTKSTGQKKAKINKLNYIKLKSFWAERKKKTKQNKNKPQA